MGVVWAECAVRLSRLGHYIVHMHGVRGSLCLKGFGWLKSTEILALKYMYVHVPLGARHYMFMHVYEHV